MIYGLRVNAHWLSHILFRGDVGVGLFVCHHCDNPICVNPDHLFIGTTQDNTQDKVNKGRQVKGSGSPLAVLTEEDIRNIRKEYSEGGTSHRRLGLKFKVTYAHFKRILEGKSWKHI